MGSALTIYRIDPSALDAFDTDASERRSNATTLADALTASDGKGVEHALYTTNATEVETLDPCDDFLASISEIVAGYGEIGMLGFLLAQPAREDVWAHHARMPNAWRTIAFARGAWCILPDERAALGMAWRIARKDAFAQCPRAAEMRTQPFLADDPSRRSVELWWRRGDFGAIDPATLPEARPESRPRPAPPPPPAWYLRPMIAGPVAAGAVLAASLGIWLALHFR